MGILRVAGRRHHVVFLCVNPRSIPCEILSVIQRCKPIKRERERWLVASIADQSARAYVFEWLELLPHKSTARSTSLVLVATALDHVHELSAPPFARRCCLQSREPASKRERARELLSDDEKHETHQQQRDNRNARIACSTAPLCRRLSSPQEAKKESERRR